MSEKNNNEGASGEELSKIQSPDQGKDPNVDGPADSKALHNIKMTGEGAPGSHSAVFGLTPDGQKHQDTTSTTTVPKPAHSGQSAMGGGSMAESTSDSGNTASTAASGAGVADQMNDPNVAEKGHSGSAVESTAGQGEKPGAGADIAPQGSGDVSKEGGSGGGSLMDKAKSYMGGS